MDEQEMTDENEYLIAENAKLKRQRDMLLAALKPIIEYPGIREYIGSILADKAQAAIAAVESEK